MDFEVHDDLELNQNLEVNQDFEGLNDFEGNLDLEFDGDLENNISHNDRRQQEFVAPSFGGNSLQDKLSAGNFGGKFEPGMGL